jgi:hypothetical protein
MDTRERWRQERGWDREPLEPGDQFLDDDIGPDDDSFVDDYKSEEPIL